MLLGVTAFFCVGIAKLQTEIGYRAFLGANHPTVTAFDDFLDRYGEGLTLAAVWSCDDTDLCESVFDETALEMAYTASTQIAATPGLAGVDSPATSRLAVVDALGIEARRLVEFGEPVAARATLAQLALEDPLWRGRIVSHDGRAGVIAARLASSSSRTALAAYEAFREALAPFSRDGFEFAFVGGPLEFIVAGPELERDVRRLVPIMIAIVGVVICLVFHSVGQTLATLAAVGVAAIWTVGLAGWLGWPQTSLSQVLAPLVLVMGVCDSIHLLTIYDHQRSSAPPGAGHADVLAKAAGEVFLPALVTSVTTAAGLLSFCASDIESLAHVGMAGAFGVMAALFLTFTLLPVLLLAVPALPPGAVRAAQRWRTPLTALHDISVRRRPAITLASIAVVTLSVLGLSRVSFEASFEDLYGEDSDVVRWAAMASEHLAGAETLEIDLVVPDGGSMISDENFAVLSRTQQALSGLAGINGIVSIASVVEHLSLHFGTGNTGHGSASSEDEREALLRGFRAFDRRALNLWVTPDRARSRLSLAVGKLPQAALDRLSEEVESVLDDTVPPSWDIEITGSITVVQRMLEDIRKTQLSSFALAGALVYAILLLFVRSPYLAMLGMLPTAGAAIVVLGIMGLSGIPLDVGTSMVAAIVLGVGVDDAVHLLCRHKRLRAAGLDTHRAMRDAEVDVGRAVVASSAALAAGFASLTTSAWGSVSAFGVVAAIAIACALFATLLLLPALVEAREG